MLREDTTAREREDHRKEEMKKNKAKYALIPTQGMPRQAPIIASHYATR
jgi:hypothetical protein